MARDYLLRQVMEKLCSLPVEDGAGELLERRLRIILMRSKEELKDFGGFYCLRLVLDQQSPLASYFIDFFSHLEFLLLELCSIEANQAKKSLYLELLKYLKPVSTTCRLLYATHEMLHTTMTDPPGQIAAGEFKRKGRRQGRQFSSNLLHCRMRHMASVYLDQPGCSRLSLKQELGTGAFATVYKGAFEHLDCGFLKTGRLVAVKMFKDGDSARCSVLGSNFASKLLQSMLRMTDRLHDNPHNFIAELDKLVVAKHPNVVTPIGYIGRRPEGECGLVMELMDESLSDYLRKVNDGRVRPLKELDMLDLMLEIARGMRFLHECELIHLDLKPENVLLRFSNEKEHPPEVKLADLGLTTLSAFFQDEMKCQDMAPLGTSCYMAPEIRAQKGHYNDKVDVFSYGTICFNILIGNPNPCAFSESIPHFYEAMKTGCWKQWVQGRNPFLAKLIARCWEMDPSMRPTFATICMLLQQAIQCLLAPSFLSSATQCLCPDSITLLKELNNDKKLGHRRIYDAISVYHNQSSGVVVDLEVMERSVLHFESHFRENADALPLDKKLLLMERLSGKAEECGLDDDGENGSEVETDVSIFLKAWAEGHFNKAISCRNKTMMGTSWWKRRLQRGGRLTGARREDFRKTMLESCLNEADALILIKAHGYLNLLQWFNEGPQRWGDLGNSIQQRDAFNFNEDEARVPLEVDTSLIPLLVGFWSSCLPYPVDQEISLPGNTKHSRAFRLCLVVLVFWSAVIGFLVSFYGYRKSDR